MACSPPDQLRPLRGGIRDQGSNGGDILRLIGKAERQLQGGYCETGHGLRL